MPQIKNGGAFGFGFGRPSFARKKNQEGFFGGYIRERRNHPYK
jgi:hypothetical protein